jgi:hypothetical protein
MTPLLANSGSCLIAKTYLIRPMLRMLCSMHEFLFLLLRYQWCLKYIVTRCSSGQGCNIDHKLRYL